MRKECKIFGSPNAAIGLHLTRAPWDPYPWVSGIQEGSRAESAGLREGDTVLELNGHDVLGETIFEIASLVHEYFETGASFIEVVIWRNDTYVSDGSCSDAEPEVDENSVIGVRDKKKQKVQQKQHCTSIINRQSLGQLATCLQHIVQLLECPICLELTKPPGWQCCNGHVLCNNCRNRSVRCPICRVQLGPRGRCLLSDKLFTVLAESFPCDGVRNGYCSQSGRISQKSKSELKSLTETETAKECAEAVAKIVTTTTATQNNNAASNESLNDAVGAGCGGDVNIGATNQRCSFLWLRGGRTRKGQEERQPKSTTNEQLSNGNNKANNNSGSNNNNSIHITPMPSLSLSNLSQAQNGCEDVADAANVPDAANVMGAAAAAVGCGDATEATSRRNNLLFKLNFKSLKRAAGSKEAAHTAVDALHRQ